jgi:Fe2+ transport system protein FeoA
MSHRKMSTLAEGERARVADIELKGSICGRLRGLGLIEGGKVECLHRSASGSIAAYLICGAVIAIRREDADNIIII